MTWPQWSAQEDWPFGQHGSPGLARQQRIKMDNCHYVKYLIGPLLVARETNWFDSAGWGGEI